jgi:hypothetical protein
MPGFGAATVWGKLQAVAAFVSDVLPLVAKRDDYDVDPGPLSN